MRTLQAKSGRNEFVTTTLALIPQGRCKAEMIFQCAWNNKIFTQWDLDWCCTLTECGQGRNVYGNFV